MSALQQLRHEIGVAQGDGKKPLRWVIRTAALDTIVGEAEQSSLTADPAAEANRTLLGLPYKLGNPSNGKDVELICAADDR